MWVTNKIFNLFPLSEKEATHANYACSFLRNEIDDSIVKYFHSNPSRKMRVHSRDEDYFHNLSPLIEWIEGNKLLKPDKLLDRNSVVPARLDLLFHNIPGVVTTQQLASKLYTVKNLYQKIGWPLPFGDLTPKGLEEAPKLNELHRIYYADYQVIWKESYKLIPKSSIYSDKVLERTDVLLGVLNVSIVHPERASNILDRIYEDSRHREYIDWLIHNRNVDPDKLDWLSLPRSLISDDEVITEVFRQNPTTKWNVLTQDIKLVNELKRISKYASYSRFGESVFSSGYILDKEDQSIVLVDHGSFDYINSSSCDGIYDERIGQLMSKLLSLGFMNVHEFPFWEKLGRGTLQFESDLEKLLVFFESKYSSILEKKASMKL